MWKTVGRYALVAIGAVGLVLAWIMFRERKSPAPVIRADLEAVRAQAQAEKTVAALGRDAALRNIAETYAAELEALDAEERKEADELTKDPGRLAAFLVRAGARHDG
jgi:hypothetical protein